MRRARHRTAPAAPRLPRAPQRRGGRADLGRLAHPFPSILDAIVTAAFALVAGASASTALLLGGAMVCLQASIGALDDLADAADRVSKPGRPLVRGAITLSAASRSVVVAGLVAGLVLSAIVGLGALVVALLGVGTGYLYDLRFKGTGLAWVPFAVGVPLLPVYAWVGATGTLPRGVRRPRAPRRSSPGRRSRWAIQLADLGADRQAGVGSTARRTGAAERCPRSRRRFTGVALAAVVSLAVLGGRGGIAVAAAGIRIAALGVAAAAKELGVFTRRAWELGIGNGSACRGLNRGARGHGRARQLTAPVAPGLSRVGRVRWRSRA